MATPEQVKKFYTMFSNFTEKMLKHKFYVHPWKYSFRASSIPFCDWYVTLSKMYEGCEDLLPPTLQPPHVNNNFMKDYFTNVGSIVHTVAQRWYGRMGILLGNYKCPECGTIVEDHLGWPKACPNKECKGTEEWEYIEYDLTPYVKEFGMVSAHCDGLIQFKGMEPDTYYLIDFKTCSLKTMPDQKTRLTDKFHLKYLTQLGFYHHVLAKHKGFKIIGTAFVFVPRDNPAMMTPIFYDQNKTAENIFEHIVESYNECMLAAKIGDFNNITKACMTCNEEPDCPFNSICFNKKDRKEELNKLFLKKFGRTYEDK